MFHVVCIIVTVLTLLCAGLLFSFSTAINGGLHKLSDEIYAKSMQSINRVILNPIFMVVFMGPVFLLPAATFMTPSHSGAQFYVLLVSSLLYIFGVFGVTIGGNEPLNKALDVADLSSGDKATQARKAFEMPWNKFHAVRTFLAVVSGAGAAYALTL